MEQSQSNPLDLFQSKSSPLLSSSLDITQLPSQFRVALIGTTMSGKTTLCSLLSYHHQNEKYEKTSSMTEFTYHSVNNIQVKLLDLCGSEKYFRNTLYGMTSLYPDYAMVVISGNNSITQNTKEHIGIALILQIPIFIVVTKKDITPPDIMSNTLEEINKFVMTSGFQCGKPEMITENAIRNKNKFILDKTVDMMIISTNSNSDISLLRQYIDKLSLLKKEGPPIQYLNPQFNVINSVYAISSILYTKAGKHNNEENKDSPTIVNGICLKGTIYGGKNMFIGPDTKGDFHPVQINSIHNDKESIEKVNETFLCSLSITPLFPSYIDLLRKGMILVSSENPLPKSYKEFTAEIVILHQSTTIKQNYFCVVYSHNIAQSAQITWVSKPVMKSGDIGKAKFLFVKYPECISVDDLLIIFETRIRAIGKVIEINN